MAALPTLAATQKGRIIPRKTAVIRSRISTVRRFIPMKQSRFTDSQIMAILKQAETGTPVPQLCREHSMSSASFYKWRAKYGGMDTIHDGQTQGA